MAWLPGTLLLLGACETRTQNLMTVPESSSIRLASVDPDFHLSPQQRSTLAQGFDAEALERLLSLITPELRAEILSYFQASPTSRGHLVELNDPQLQAILEEVWAPMWDGAPDQALDENWYGIPGREVARTQRARKRLAPERRAP